MTEAVYLNALNMVPSLSARKIRTLLACLPGAESAWSAPLSDLKLLEGWEDLAEKFVLERREIDVFREWEKLKENDFIFIADTDNRYPALLKQIPSPPIGIYVQGDADLNQSSLAVVGSRKATYYGREVALKLAGEIAAAGLTVVSGMALGIDTYAHRGALESTGKTVAVLGSGLDICYPSQNVSLKKKIAARGAVVSEFPPGTKPLPSHFPQRNRIISGLSLGTLVIEAPEKSGALITADFALEQGREVFAVPGSIGSPYSRGCHRLIKQGAKLVENVDDILEELGFPGSKPSGYLQQQRIAFLTPEENILFSIISYHPSHLDEIVRHSPLSVSQASSLLLNMEIKGVIRQLSGKYFIRA